MPRVSVVVPTYNEGANIGPLLQALDEAFAGVDAEFVVVDDNSKDGTADKARLASPRARVIVRTAERGLATAVVRGIAEAQGTFVAVMDADFQHPPRSVRALYDRAEATDADLVVGSRYAAGGTEGEFGAVRRTISRGAAFLSRVALPPVRQHRITDPMSGLFLVRRARVDTTALSPQGYKILLELLARCEFPRVEEVGYKFDTRREGESKLGAGVLVQYLLHLAALGMAHPGNRRALQFMMVGLSGVLVNLGLLVLLHDVVGVDQFLALLVAIEASILSNFLLNDRFTFRDRRDAPWLGRLGMFQLVSLGGMAMNIAVYFVLAYLLLVHYLVADAIAIVAAFGVNYLGNMRLTYGGRRRPRVRTWLPIALLALAAAGFYLVGLGPIPIEADPPEEPNFLETLLQTREWGIRDIYFDEHYYITVAHQMDAGVIEDPCWIGDQSLDHRPLNYEHPPLAKLIMWASVHAYDTYPGEFTRCRSPDDEANGGKAAYDAFTQGLREEGNPWAWRAPSAIMGIVTVGFAALAARRIFQSDLAGALAGSFVLLDNLMLSSARIALLDIFAAGFLMVAVYCATFPRRRGIVLTAVFLGLGFACKYYVVFAGVPVLLLSLWMHRRAGLLRRRRFDWHVLSYALIPPLVWIASYAPWWWIWIRDHGLGWAMRHWLKVQAAAVSWGTAGGDQGHQYQSTPVEWLWMTKPMSYITSGHAIGGDYVARYIYAIGNPALWWIAIAAFVYVAIDFIGDWLISLRRRLVGPIGFLLGMPRMRQALVVTALLPLVTFLGFIPLDRTTYIFYMTLVVPGFALLVGGALAATWHHGGIVGRAATVLGCAVIVAAFAWYFPISIYLEIPRSHYHRIFDLVPWMHECGRDAVCAD